MVIIKKRYSGFYGTTLDETLARLAPDAIILAGINTHACIRTTAVDAYQRD
jgi:maleamate amidohydrolase